LQALGGGGSARGRKSATPRLSAEGGRSKDPPRHAPPLLPPLLLPPLLLTPLLPAPRAGKVEGGESGGVVVDTRGAATRLL
jgi:hypothetical protein